MSSTSEMRVTPGELSKGGVEYETVSFCGIGEVMSLPMTVKDGLRAGFDSDCFCLDLRLRASTVAAIKPTAASPPIAPPTILLVLLLRPTPVSLELSESEMDVGAGYDDGTA